MGAPTTAGEESSPNREPRSLRGLVLKLLADQRVRFLIVGGVNTVVGYGLYALLYLLWLDQYSWGYMVSFVISTAIAMCVAFVLHRKFVFRVTGHVARDFTAFVGVNAVAVLTNAAVLPLLVELARLPPLAAQVVVMLLTTIISYFGHREVSFRR